MKALLLAAGVGSRLRPLVDVLPKCLMPINGRPLLEYWLNALVQAGVTEILINLHYKAKLVEKYLMASPFKKYVTLAFEKDLLGTGGTIVQNQGFFNNSDFLVIHADNLSHFDMDEFIQSHKNRPRQCEMTMLSFTTDQPEKCGILKLDDDNIVTNFFEKVQNPPGRLANGAVYIFTNEVLKFIVGLDENFIDLSDKVIPHFLNRIFVYHNDIYHRDIGNPESYMKAQLEYAFNPHGSFNFSWLDAFGEKERETLFHDFCFKIADYFGLEVGSIGSQNFHGKTLAIFDSFKESIEIDSFVKLVVYRNESKFLSQQIFDKTKIQNVIFES